MTERITNEFDQVAIAYYQPQSPVLVQGTPSGTEYTLTAKSGVSMAWVDPTDVDHLLSKRGGCCSGRMKRFRLANQAQVDIWQR